MNTLLLKNTDTDLLQAAEIIKRGGIVAIPTETVYGLAADALNGAAVAKIFQAKNRPMDNPLIVHIAETEDIKKLDLVQIFPDMAKKLAETFWPGPLTIILPKSDIIPDEVSAGLDTVAVRCPSHSVANKLIRLCGTALAAPSANLSGSPSPTSAKHCIHDLDGSVDAILDGGECEVGLESTVISLSVSPPRLLRPGGITLSQLENVLGHVDVDEAVLNRLAEGQKAASPGMKYKHYAPRAQVILIKGNDDQYCNYVNAHAGKDIAALCYDEDAERLVVQTFELGEKNDYPSHAHGLFKKLRDIDADSSIRTVYARCPVADGVGMAVYNRLIRAAGFEVIDLEKL